MVDHLTTLKHPEIYIFSVKQRMENETGINFAEFSYQIFQAYDWVHLLDKFNCRIQVSACCTNFCEVQLVACNGV